MFFTLRPVQTNPISSNIVGATCWMMLDDVGSGVQTEPNIVQHCCRKHWSRQRFWDILPKLLCTFSLEAMAAQVKERQCLAAMALLELLEDEETRIKRGKTRAWIRRREEKGYFTNIVRELMIEDPVAYRRDHANNTCRFHGDIEVSWTWYISSSSHRWTWSDKCTGKIDTDYSIACHWWNLQIFELPVSYIEISHLMHRGGVQSHNQKPWTSLPQGPLDR